MACEAGGSVVVTGWIDGVALGAGAKLNDETCDAANLYQVKSFVSDTWQEWNGRFRQPSIDYGTCHDGFTLNDIVSYNGKHNEANGNDQRDGANDT